MENRKTIKVSMNFDLGKLKSEEKVGIGFKLMLE